MTSVNNNQFLHICNPYTSKAQRLQHYNSHKPEELVEVSVFHVLKDHDKWICINTDAVELHYVLVLKVGQQLGLPLEVWPRRKGGILQGLRRHIRRTVYCLTTTKTPRNNVFFVGEIKDIVGESYIKRRISKQIIYMIINILPISRN